MKLGRLREWRERRGLLQEDLAGMVGVNRRSVSLWETGKSGIRPTKAREVAEALGVAIDDLLAPSTAVVMGDPKVESWSGPGSAEALFLDPKMAPLLEDHEAFDRRVSTVRGVEAADDALYALSRAADRAKVMRESAYRQAYSGWLSDEGREAGRGDIGELDRVGARFGSRFGRLWRRQKELVAREVEALDPAEALDLLEAAKRDRGRR